MPGGHTLALIQLVRCLVSYLGDPKKFSIVFPIVFQANTGNKLWEKIPEEITGTVNLMLKIPIQCKQSFEACSKHLQFSKSFDKKSLSLR